MLTAVGRDANNQIYPVAWAVVKTENSDNWLWFVQRLKADLVLGDGSRFVLISDGSKVSISLLDFLISHMLISLIHHHYYLIQGLISAVKAELPNAEHR